jgi:hypothetical protein
MAYNQIGEHMKYFLMLMLAIATAGFAREVPDSLLTAEQMTRLNANAKVADAKANVAVVSTYLGVGHEIGVAVNDAMSAITDQANKFANTDVGRMVKWIIIYKICKGLVLGMLSIIITWIVIIFGNAAVYFFYVRNNKDEKIANNTDNICRGDFWVIVLLISITLGVITTWITLGNIG